MEKQAANFYENQYSNIFTFYLPVSPSKVDLEHVAKFFEGSYRERGLAELVLSRAWAFAASKTSLLLHWG